ncbi:FliH/SctL family protein [Neomoorella humiferrea]|uniref:FliH/SctL family protein n=1 Tax=Neomoorella humiferrea TaxID=676965 RepID=UPI003D94A35B
MPLWSRVLKKAGPGRGERVIPLRPLAAVSLDDAGGGEPKPAGEGAAAEAEERETAALKKAEAILEEARREARAIKEAAEAARLKVLEEARAAGEERGYREGLSRGEAEAAAIRQEAAAEREAARRVLAEARQAYKEILKGAEGDIVELALAVAAKILGREVEQRPEAVVETARRAVRQVAEGQNYIVYAAPEVAEHLRRYRGELLREAAPGARLQVIADPSFKAGGCRVETENGFIDAGFANQLEELKKIFRAQREGAEAPPGAKNTTVEGGEP